VVEPVLKLDRKTGFIVQVWLEKINSMWLGKLSTINQYNVLVSFENETENETGVNGVNVPPVAVAYAEESLIHNLTACRAVRLTAPILISRPDLIILDVELLEKEGTNVRVFSAGLFQSARVNSIDLNGVPVLLLANDDGFAEVADDILIKPITPKQLSVRIKMLLTMQSRFDNDLQKIRAEKQSVLDQLAQHEKRVEEHSRQEKVVASVKDAIVNTVAHELRTPLLHVKAASSGLLDETNSQNSRYAEYIRQAIARLETVVTNMAQLAAAVRLKFETFHLLDAVNAGVRNVQRSWTYAKGAEQRIRVMITDNPLIVGDRSAVAQVVQHLLDNALKFSPETSAVEITAEIRADGVCVSVRDYGIGIPEDQIGEIFQPFYQVSSGTTRKFGGTGVGLALVKLICDGLGAKIEVWSEPGQGSAFSVTLPKAQQENPAETPQAAVV
jgi:signal transduction histidine kinase